VRTGGKLSGVSPGLSGPNFNTSEEDAAGTEKKFLIAEKPAKLRGGNEIIEGLGRKGGGENLKGAKKKGRERAGAPAKKAWQGSRFR